jgi:hypothetical protein
MLAEHGGAQSAPNRGNLQIHVSKLLLGSSVAAIATSVAMIVAAVMIIQAPPPPPGPNGPPPPPPNSAVVMIVITGMFVVSWLAVVVALARDQILRRLRELDGEGADREETHALLGALRQELAEDRRADLASLQAQIVALTTEYGEQRETDGYVNGMRVATRSPYPGAEVRPLHPVPPTA